MSKMDPNALMGRKLGINWADFGETDFHDTKIAFAVRGTEGKSVLDIGCVQHNPENYQSKYWVHKALTARAGSVVGLDLDSEGADYLRSRGFDIVAMDAQDFDLGRKFDVIFAGDVLEHLEDFGGFLASCKAHLNPGGELRITTPNPWYWRNIVKAIWNKEVANNPEHTCWLCPRTLRQLVRRHGLDVFEITFSSRYPRDLLMPLPRGIKHTSWYASVRVANS